MHCRSDSSVSEGFVKEILFNDLNMNDNIQEYNNLIGSLKGNVQFAQSHIIPSKPSTTTGKYWAHLVSLRDTLVLFKPLGIEDEDVDDADDDVDDDDAVDDDDVEDAADVLLEVLDQNGDVIEWSKTNKEMMKPNELPKPAQSIHLTNANWKSVLSANLRICNGKYKSVSLDDMEVDEMGAHITTEFDDVAEESGLKIQLMYTWKNWKIKNIYLPMNNPNLDGKFITFSNRVYWSSYINSDLRKIELSGHTTKCFVNHKGKWIESSDFASEYRYGRIRYGKNFWSKKLPSHVIKPGISMKFTFKEKAGDLNNIKIGAPNELLINTIDLGFLTPYRDQFTFQQNPEYQSQYLQQIPASRLIVNQYEPITFEKMVLKDGTAYTMEKGSNDNGGWQSGDLRALGKYLIGIGINNANYGVHSSSGKDHYGTFACAQLNAHNTRGKYQNGIKTHGGSGGSGLVTLDSSVGNEFSHECGHNYGIGHYPAADGVTQSLHRPSDTPGSTWGWDSRNNVFLPNFQKEETERETCHDCDATYIKDICQDAEKDKSVGNKNCQAPFEKLYSFGKDAMAGGEPFYKATNQFTMHTPYSSYLIQEWFESKAVFDDTSKTGMRRWLPKCNCMAEWKSYWPKEALARQPKWQGVAVATLLGFYDPLGKMESYIYPALHSAYGNIFRQSSEEEIAKSRCMATIVNRKGYYKEYVLTGERQKDKWMNKIHINVEESFQPQKIAIKCRDTENDPWRDIDIREITEPNKEMIYTINGNG